MKIWHMSGAGNDFAVVDARGRALELAPLARTLCARLGTDGFMALDSWEGGDFRLHFYNADGSRGEMCGNGARCICRFANDLGLAGETLYFLTDAGPVTGWRLDGGRYRVRLNAPSVLDRQRLPGVAYVELGDPGIPHAVKELPDLAWEQRDQLRPLALRLRHDPVFPKGVNLTFYRVLEPGEVRVLTFERGVEDYTLACGTGCGSLAWVLRQDLPQGRLLCHNPGGDLTVCFEGEALYLEGPTEVLAVYDE